MAFGYLFGAAQNNMQAKLRNYNNNYFIYRVKDRDSEGLIKGSIHFIRLSGLFSLLPLIWYF